MKNKKIFTRFLRIFVLIAMVISFLPWPAISLTGTKKAEAAAINLITDPSFNQDINKTWFLWKGEAINRSYTLARGYDTPFGGEPYAMTIKAEGPSTGRQDAGIVSTDLNRFSVSSGKNYSFSFYAKATSSTRISLFLQRADNYQAISSVQEVAISDTWERKQISFTPNDSGAAALVIVFGDLSENNTLYLDEFNLFENNATLTTLNVSGFIGDQNKSLTIANGNLFTLNELKIELPYLDEQTGLVTTKQFAPKSKKGGIIYFDIPEQTFGGVGKVYAINSVIGQFDYNVLLRISDYGPNPVRADEDLVVYGSGFNPNNEQNFIIVSAINSQGRVSEKWINPHIIDNRLSQVVITLPVGITNGRLSARTYHANLSGASIENKSKTLNYTVKPVIHSLSWSRKGYEQIGDKITILGQGIANRPVVYFYDENDKLISSAGATIKTINETERYEAIEVATPKQLNKLKVTVKVGAVESDKAEALNYSARPILASIKSSRSRKMAISDTQIAAAKVGDNIKLIGQGYKNATAIAVNFSGLNGNIKVPVGIDKIDTAGNWLEVTVPKEAQNGQVSVETNGQTSNPLPLEIIPTIISITPLTPWPGEEMSFWTNGVGLDKSLTTVYFKLTNNETVAVAPTSLEKSGDGDVIVKVIAPKAISNDSSVIKLQYGNWLNDQSYSLKTAPYIEGAGIDVDTKILSIKGHGFSNVLAENKIIYKYADGTIVDPKVKMLSVKNTSEGQEIKIQILDNYYYGRVSVTVKDQTSNEFNIGPAVITRVERRVQFVKAENRVMGVLYISGKNFGTNGDVKVGDVWAQTHYRTNYFIIAVVESADLNKNPVIVTKSQ